MHAAFCESFIRKSKRTIFSTMFDWILIQMCLQLSTIQCSFVLFVRFRRRIGIFGYWGKIYIISREIWSINHTHHHCMFREQTALNYAIDKQLDVRQNSLRIWNPNRKWFAFTLYKSWFSLSLTSDTTLCVLSCFFFICFHER